MSSEYDIYSSCAIATLYQKEYEIFIAFGTNIKYIETTCNKEHCMQYDVMI